MEVLNLLSHRDNSKVWRVKWEGRILAYKEVYSNDPKFPIRDVLKSCEFAYTLPENDLLVKIDRVWIKEGASVKESKVCILMEYLDGYERISHNKFEKMKPAINFLIKNGLVDWDLSPINFLEKDGKVKMIDLDRLVKISDLPESPKEDNWILTWFGSRMIKILKLI